MIAAWLAAHRLSYVEFAAETGVSTALLEKLCNGRYKHPVGVNHYEKMRRFIHENSIDLVINDEQFFLDKGDIEDE